MHFVQLGSASSKAEYHQIVQAAAKAKGDRAIEAMEFVTSILRAEQQGFVMERKRWQRTSHQDVHVFVGGDPEPGATTIWVAISVGANNKTIVVLKVMDSYGGGNDEGHALLADAVDRKARGRII